MSVDIHAIRNYLHDFLGVSRFRDYAPNGLQVEGRLVIKKIVSGVTASRLLIEAAVKANADAILVHHGYFWRNEDPCVVGMKKERLRALLAADLSLFAYHLPLDAHADLAAEITLDDQLLRQLDKIWPGPRGEAPEAYAW